MVRVSELGIPGGLLLAMSAQLGCGAPVDESDGAGLPAMSSAPPTITMTTAPGSASAAGSSAPSTSPVQAGRPAIVIPTLAAAGASGMSPAAAAAGSAAAGTSASAAGAGGLGGSAAAGAAGGAPIATGDDPCGPDAKEITGMTRAQGNGNTNLQTSGDVEFLSAKSTLIVPKEPTPTRGTLFLWPGLQPLRQDQTVGYGVLQPVLTWGSSCAPGSLSTSDGWWISAQYVGTPPGSFSVNCKGGKTMKVEVGDKLDIEMALNGTSWKQTVTNQRNGESVDFTIDLKGQKQQWLLHQIEVPTMTKPVDDVIFTSLVAKLSASQPQACLPNAKGMNDYYAPPRASADGKTCCISKIILRASGVAKSSPDAP